MNHSSASKFTPLYWTYWRRLSVLLVSSILLLSTGAQAELTSVDLFDPDDGLLTLDDATGLEWLDLTYLLGFSVQEVLDDDLAAGFRWATNSEVKALYESQGIIFASGPGNTPAFIAENYPGGSLLHDLMGCTFECNGSSFPGQQGSSGINEIEDGKASMPFIQLAGEAAYAGDPFNTNVDPSNVPIGCCSDTTAANPGVGHYLVRADDDDDGVPDADDNCPTVANSGQEQTGNNIGGQFGDACVDPTVTIPASAYVDPTATVGPNTEINKNVIVGPGATIGSDVVLNKNVEVGEDATVESGVLLDQGVFIGPRTFIGANSLIGKNTVFCADSGVGANSDIGKNNFITLVWPDNTTLGGINGAAPDPASCP